MENDKELIASVYHKIEREKALISAARNIRQSTNNPQVQQRVDTNIRDGQKNIVYLEEKMRELELRKSGGDEAPHPPPKDGFASGGANPPTSPSTPAPKGRPNFGKLDLIKYDTPYLGPKIQLMLSQLEFKLSVEKQYKEGIEKMMRLYQYDGDRKSRADAEGRRIESNQKIQLLKQALKRYEDLHVNIEGAADQDDESVDAPNIRRPLTGNLSMRIHAVRDVDHAASSRFSRGPETFVIVKVEDAVRAKTRSTRSDRWTEEAFTINIDKANELELTVYDKSSGDRPTPIGMLWIRISDIVEEMRRKKIETEFNASGWVSADKMQHGGPAVRPDGHFAAAAPPPQMVVNMQPQQGQGGPGPTVMVDSWFALEPVGRIHLSMSFAKQMKDRRPYDIGLNRQGAVRQKKEEIVEKQGHKFVAHQFYNIMRCAICGDFIKYSTGLQCSDCKYTCHKKCYPKVVTKCISKAADPDEEKINHRIPHRFETFANISANWCCHCGYLLPFGRKNAKRCTECGLACHSHCVHLVPDFCGMSMEAAYEILKTIKSPMSERTLRTHASRPSEAGQAASPKPPSHDALAAATSSYTPPPTTVVPPRKPPPSAAAATATRVTGDSSTSPQTGYSVPEPPSVHTPPAQQAIPPQIPPPKQYDPGAYVRYPQAPQVQPVPVPAPAPQYNIVQHPQMPVQTPVSQPPAKVPAPQLQPPQQPSSKPRVWLDHFNFLAVLGKGNFGKVMLAETKATKKLYAIKVLKKEFIIENDEVESTKSEKRVFLIANKERHPFLTNLHACFQTETRVYFVMEYISGGDLMLHIQRGQFGLRRSQFYAAEVCLALKYFHENGVIYRDLKLDNIMLTLDGHIKIADYGLCKEEMWYGCTTGTFCGTPEFMAPEILLDKKYGRAVDWWAFGVLIYQMLLQQSPFRGDDEDEIYDAILADEPLYPIQMPRDSVSILQKLLTREPDLRLGSGPTDAQEIMSHAFFRTINWDDVYHKRVQPPFLPQISNATDTSNFDQEFTSVTPVLTPVQTVLSQQMQEQFRGFSYHSGDL